jgi:hypothetical protein
MDQFDRHLRRADLGRMNAAGADFERDERIAVAGLAQLPEAHAIGARSRQLHVVDDLVPSHQLVSALIR